MSGIENNRRKPSIAVVLSLVCPGLGHIYCGQFAIGLALFLASLLPGPLVMAAALSGTPSAVPPGLILLCIVVAGVYLYAIAGTYRLAKRIGPQYQPKDYNRGVVYDLFALAGIINPVSVAMSVAATLFVAVYCDGGSMAPTILKGDRFLVNKLFQRRLPERGDVILLMNPHNPELRFVKRVIALPGDSVAVRGSEVYVNGRQLAHHPAPEYARALMEDVAGEELYESNGPATYPVFLATSAEKVADYPDTMVPQGHCFVLGDDRNRSLDSRQFGCVPLGNILGKVQYVYWPARRWSRFGTVE